MWLLLTECEAFMNDLSLVSKEIGELTVYRPTKQEVLLTAIQEAITELLDCAGNAENSNEVENYMRAVKPLTNALLVCARMEVNQ